MAVGARQLDRQPARTPLRPARPPLRGIRGGAKRRRPYISVVLVLLMTVFGVSALQAYLGQEGLRVAELERRVAAAEERLTLLRAKQAQLSAPGRLAEEAARAGLVPDTDPTFLPAPEGHRAEQDPTDRIHAVKRLTSDRP